VNNLYAVWLKIDETLPWIELKGTYQTRGDAKKAAEEFLNAIKTKLVKVAETKRQMKALATAKQ